MSRKLLISTLAALFVLAIAVTAAYATVTFDPATGIGFVGKGDVQTAFGWNNAQLQANADDINFTYEEEAVYNVTEEWSTLAGGVKNTYVNTHQVFVTATVVVNNTITFDPRSRNQLTGFDLTGWGTTLSQGTVPNIGDVVVDRQNDRNSNGLWFDGVEYPTDTVITGVTLVSATPGGLYVNYGTSSVLIWPTQ